MRRLHSKSGPRKGRQHFEEVIQDNDTDRDTIAVPDVIGTVFPPEFQVRRREQQGKQYRQQGGVQQKALRHMTLKQRYKSPLHTAARAIKPCKTFVRTRQ